jgi:hypothetical protein
MKNKSIHDFDSFSFFFGTFCFCFLFSLRAASQCIISSVYICALILRKKNIYMYTVLFQQKQYHWQQAGIEKPIQ